MLNITTLDSISCLELLVRLSRGDWFGDNEIGEIIFNSKPYLETGEYRDPAVESKWWLLRKDQLGPEKILWVGVVRGKNLWGSQKPSL